MGNVPDVSASFIIKSNNDTPPLLGSFSGTLAEKVSKPDYLHQLLTNFKCTDSLSDAISQQYSLKAGEVFITKDGVLLGSNWLKTQAKESANKHDGVLERQQQIDETLLKLKRLKNNFLAMKSLWKTDSSK